MVDETVVSFQFPMYCLYISLRVCVICASMHWGVD